MLFTQDMNQHAKGLEGRATHIQNLTTPLSTLRKMCQEGKTAPAPLFQQISRRDDLADMAPALELLAPAPILVVLGTGGSSLGAQALLSALKGWQSPAWSAKKELIFADNLDANSFSALLAREDCEDMRFLVISKSGSTPETLMQFIAAKERVKNMGAAKTRFIIMTMKTPSPLREIAEEENILCLEHEAEIGGRFSVLTNIGLLPAMAMGIDGVALREGAQKTLTPLIENKPPDQIPAAQAAAMQMAAEQQGYKTSIMMSYSDRLSHFGLWYRQLWAESLGKEGKGTLPVHSPCPLDHHSQLQLYAEGANDKIYSILTITDEPEKLPMPVIEKKELKWLSQKTASAMVSAQAQGTRDALDALNRPIRGITLHGLGEQQMGALLMHFMLETILTAALMNINAFDQQGVEDSKRRAKAYMQKG